MKGKTNFKWLLFGLVCVLLVFMGEAKAGQAKAKHKFKTDKASWTKCVNQGHTESGVRIDAEIVERNGKKYIQEEDHPLQIPDNYRAEDSIKGNRLSFIKGADSTKVIYHHEEKPYLKLIIMMYDGTAGQYMFANMKTMEKIKHRVSYDADENFEQTMHNSADSFRIFWTLYYDKERFTKTSRKKLEDSQ